MKDTWGFHAAHESELDIIEMEIKAIKWPQKDLRY